MGIGYNIYYLKTPYCSARWNDSQVLGLQKKESNIILWSAFLHTVCHRSSLKKELNHFLEFRVTHFKEDKWSLCFCESSTAASSTLSFSSSAEDLRIYGYSPFLEAARWNISPGQCWNCSHYVWGLVFFFSSFLRVKEIFWSAGPLDQPFPILKMLINCLSVTLMRKNKLLLRTAVLKCFIQHLLQNLHGIYFISRQL